MVLPRGTQLVHSMPHTRPPLSRCFVQPQITARSVQAIISALLALAMVVILCGCGGSGNSTPALVAPTVDIFWAQRSKSFSGPSSALSLTITVGDVPNLVSPATLTVNRNASTSAYSQTYAIPTTLRPGPVQVTALFYSAQNGQGTLVGTATSAAILTPQGALTNSDGTFLGGIQTVGTVANVAVDSGQSVNFGSSKQLSFTARDSSNNVLALSPGSATWMTSGGHTTSTNDGIATGLFVGTDTAQVTVDNIQSPVASIAVTLAATSNFLLVNQTVSALVYNQADGKLYGAVPSTAASNPNSVVSIDPMTGAIINIVQVGSNPSTLALSDDGSMLYVGLSGASSIQPISLPTMATQPAIDLGSDSGGPFSAACIAVVPGSARTIVVSLTYTTGNPSQTIEVIDNGVVRPNTLNTFAPGKNILTFKPSSSTVVVSSTFGGLVCSVDANGIQQTGSFPGLQSGVPISDVGGKIFTQYGQVFDDTSGALLGTLPTNSGSSWSWRATSSGNGQAYLLGSPYVQQMLYRVVSTSTYSQIGTAALPVTQISSLDAVAAIGASRLAIAMTDYQSQGVLVIVKDTSVGLTITSP